MVICQYFLQGRCRFGQNCRFEHSYNNYPDERGNRNPNAGSNQANNIAWQIAKEVIAAEKGGQWPLTCFSPFKEGPCIPGWDDFSPEEVRWTLYEAQKNGTVSQCLTQINQLHSNAERARSSLKQPTAETISMINDILSGKKVLTPTNSSNTFPSSPLQTRNNPFESNSNFRFDVAGNANSVFGGTTANYSGGQNLFGNADSTSQNIFSNAQQSNPNVFSNSNQTVFSNPNQNIFSTPQSQPSSTNQNIFSTPQSQPSSTNQNIFSTPQSQPSSTNQNIFSTPQSQPSSTNQNLFSTPPSQPSASNQNIFSNTQQTNQNLFSTPPNVFNSNNSSNNGGSFPASNPIFGGGFQQNETQNFGNVFGGAQSNFEQPNPGFSQDQAAFTNFQAASTTSNVFGNPTAISQPQAGGFNPIVQTDASFYSNVDDLTEEETKSFTSPTFPFGKIPLKPPPQQYC